LGFERPQRSDEDTEAINQMFTPEFRNRLDAIVPFKSLTPEIVARVVDKFVIQLEAQLGDRNVTIDMTDAARAHLAEKGYDPAMGARPLARLIQEKIKKPLADELLFGKLANGGSVKIDFDGTNLTFIFPDAAPKALPRAREAENA
jgi:ATP-dependent Clp protease ATP-binding subunit ClpA